MGGYRLFRRNRLGRQGVVLSISAQCLELCYRISGRGLGAYRPKLEDGKRGSHGGGLLQTPSQNLL